jgi:hypothetical protein
LQDSFEKLQVAACHFSQEFLENPKNVLTNRRAELLALSSKELGKFKSYWW